MTTPIALVLVAAIAGLLLVLYRTYRSLQDRHNELAALYDLAGVMSDAVLDGTVVPSLLARARMLMHADQAWLYLANSDGRVNRFTESGTGGGPRPGDWLGDALMGIVGGGVGACRLDATDDRIRHLEPGRHVRDLVLAPLTGKEGLIGTLVVVNSRGSGQGRGFVRDDLRVFSAIARHGQVALENDRLVDRLRGRAAENEHQSLHDALTGLPNRRLFSRLVGESIAGGSQAAMLLLDLDRFKEVNDTLGHHNGDVLLQQIGARLRSTLRRGDIVARLGGDEFAVLLPGIGGEDAAVQVGRGIVDLLGQPVLIGDMSIDVGASIGIAFSPRDGSDPGSLVQKADVAMYTAKTDQSGVEIYRPERDGYTTERLMLVSELKAAVRKKELDLEYQPQLDLFTGEVVGVEALIRWSHPGRGVMPAEEFIAVAEHTGLVQPLTLLALDKALAASQRWRSSGRELRVSVNLSARGLLEPTLVDKVASLLRHHKVPAEGLCLEVTESSIMGDPRRSTATLTGLHNLGITLAIDDFGTGQSALAYIKRLPVGEIKIDKSFVLSMLTDPSDAAIVETVVSLGSNLGIPVVAEGVEDEATSATLLAMGCPIGQGYHFAHPMPESELMAWLESHDERTPAGRVVPLIGRSRLSAAAG